ncbi:MAG: PQQ-binding-like beta-propeller repeat protein [Planctomycetaceae bacterium]
MGRYRYVFLGILVLQASCPSWAADEYWNQFRGPRGDGTSSAKNLPVTFSEGSPEIVWKIPVPGRAWSSPVVWENQIWLTNGPEIENPTPEKPRPDHPLKLTALCLDLGTGKVLFDLHLFDIETPQFTHVTNSYASPTPYIEDGRVYLHYGAYGTACVNTHTGEVLWKRQDLPCDHFRGPGSSVAVYGDLLYLTMDGFDYQYLVALDKQTGDTVWKQDRGIDYGTDDGDAKKAYSTPTLIHVNGQDQLVSPFAMATIAYNPLTGEPLWTVRHGGMNAAARPIFGHGLVYINAADGKKPLLAVRPEGTGDITDRIVWQTDKGVAKRSSPLLIDDLLFMVNDSGVASCLDAQTGQTLWSKRLGGDYWASPIAANGLIYCCSQQGGVPVFKAAREFEMVAENQLDEGFNASPVVAGDSLILRSKTHLYRIENRSK